MTTTVWATGAISVYQYNDRWFADTDGNALHLVGHQIFCFATNQTYSNEDTKMADGAGTTRDVHCQADLDWDWYKDWLKDSGLNFVRIWIFLSSGDGNPANPIASPLPYARTGSGTATDGQPKFDLSEWDDTFWSRLDTRIGWLEDNDIYVSIMMADVFGFSGGPWGGNIFKSSNNDDGISTDADADGCPLEYFERPEDVDTDAVCEGDKNPWDCCTDLDTGDCTMEDLQEAFAQKMVSELGDHSNIIWEMSNEMSYMDWMNTQSTTLAAADADDHLIWFSPGYKIESPGINSTCSNGFLSKSTLLAGTGIDTYGVTPNGDGWASEYLLEPPIENEGMPVFHDIDHTGAHNTDFTTPWRSFTRGYHYVHFEDPFYDCDPDNDQIHEDLRVNIARTLHYSQRFHDLGSINPTDATTESGSTPFCSTGFLLYHTGNDYLCLQPDDVGDNDFSMYVPTGTYRYEWWNVDDVEVGGSGTAAYSGTEVFSPPDEDTAYVLWLHKVIAFPGAEGFGSDAEGWRQGTLYKVTTTSDSSTGNCDVGGGYECSLREALTASGDRVVVFTVGGEFLLNSGVDITNGNLLVAGETAPSPGVTVKGNRWSINDLDDVVIRHIKFRIGAYDLDSTQDTATVTADATGGTDTLTAGGESWTPGEWAGESDSLGRALVMTAGAADGFECFITANTDTTITCEDVDFEALDVNTNDTFTIYRSTRSRANIHIGNDAKATTDIVFDHCEFAWSAEKNVEVWHDGDRVTFSNCIFGEPLYDAYPATDTNFNMSLGNVEEMCIYDSLFIHAMSRNPYMYPDVDLNFVNNYLYNVDSASNSMILGSFASGGFRINSEGNRFESGNDTSGTPIFFFVNTAVTTGEWYVNTDNYVDENHIVLGADKPTDNDGDNSDVQAVSRVTSVWWPGRTTNVSSTVKDYVRYNSGARPNDRDTVTAGMISDLVGGTGYQLTAQEGVPDYPGGTGGPRGFTDPGTAFSGDYTLREIAIHKYAAYVEGCGPAAPTSTYPTNTQTGIPTTFALTATAFAHNNSNVDCDMYTDADLYDYTELEIDRAVTFDSNGGNPDFDTGETATDHLSINVSGLLIETTYYVRIRQGINTGAGQTLWSDWASTISFETYTTPPQGGVSGLYNILGGRNTVILGGD
jgi:CSLREA domain-containing protein